MKEKKKPLALSENKLPEHSKEVEKSVLGLCLLDETAFIRTVEILESRFFYVPDHQAVYDAMVGLHKKNQPITIMTVFSHMLETKTKLEFHSNIPHFLLILTTDTIMKTTGIEFQSLLIRGMWQEREMKKVLQEAQHSDEKASAAIKTVQQQLNEILGIEFTADWFSMEEMMYNLLNHQADISSGKKTFTKTGFNAVDQANGGFSDGDLIVVGARPSVGKSAFMGKMAVTIARQKRKVGIISLEMNNTQIAARLASLETGFDFATIYRNLFHDEAENKRFYNIVTTDLVNLPIYVSDKTAVNIDSIRAKAMKLRHTEGCDCIMVDYLQLVESEKGSGKSFSREQEVAKISRGLKVMAMEMQIPVILLCQLSRAVTSRTGTNRYPQLSDLRESGSIEQDADIVFMLHRDYLIPGMETNEHGQSTEREADLLCLKWRNGSIFTLKLDFDPQKMKFSERKTWTPVNPVLIDFKPKEENNDPEDLN